MVSVQSTVDTGHEDMVHDAQMDYYGTSNPFEGMMEI